VCLVFQNTKVLPRPRIRIIQYSQIPFYVILVDFDTVLIPAEEYLPRPLSATNTTTAAVEVAGTTNVHAVTRKTGRTAPIE